MNNKVIAAFLAGAVCGSLLGILFAPGKGSETRKKALNNTRDLTTNLNKRIRDGISHARLEQEDTANAGKPAS